MDSDIFLNIAKEIEEYLGSIMGVRVYSAIVDRNGKIRFAREDFNENEMDVFVVNFVKNNFDMLEVGDHSFPISGKNFGFFKISDKSMVVLHTKKGPLGALLSFKNKMFSFADTIDDKLNDVMVQRKKGKERAGTATDSEQGVPKLLTQKKFAKVPLLTKKLTGKEKFPINDVLVLNLCDGEHTIEEIIKKTRLARLAVENVIKNYEKKKYITLKRTQV